MANWTSWPQVKSGKSTMLCELKLGRSNTSFYPIFDL